MSIKKLRQISGLDSALKCIQQIGQKEEKITSTWRFQSILQTVDIKAHMKTIQKHNNEKHTYDSYKSLKKNSNQIT